MDITALTSTNAADNVANTARTGLGEDLNTFLTMLTTQLKNQDPTSPMDTHQMTEQLVNFANVEQQIAQNKNLEDLVRLQSSNADFGAINFIGREVQIDGNKTNVNSSGTTWGYQFDMAPESVGLNVLNAKGIKVYSETGNLTNSTRHNFTWDATDGNGNAVEPGTYSLQIIALNASGDPIDTKIDSVGLVSGVKSNATGPSLMLGENIEVTLAKIMKIK